MVVLFVLVCRCEDGIRMCPRHFVHVDCLFAGYSITNARVLGPLGPPRAHMCVDSTRFGVSDASERKKTIELDVSALVSTWTYCNAPPLHTFLNRYAAESPTNEAGAKTIFPLSTGSPSILFTR